MALPDSLVYSLPVLVQHVEPTRGKVALAARLRRRLVRLGVPGQQVVPVRLVLALLAPATTNRKTRGLVP